MSAPPAVRSSARGSRWRPAGLAVLAGVAAFLLGTRGESLIIHAVHGDRAKLEWISDVVVSAAVVGLTYLWVHLKESRVRVLSLEREQIALDEQLRLAAEIQRSLLPDLPAATRGFRWAARMVPAWRIGGDFYDFFDSSPGTAFAILADVSGKGIPAALILSSLKTVFRATIQAAADPATIAGRISTALYEQHRGMPYATAIVARFDAAGPSLSWTNAGHPAGYLLRGGATTALESSGPPLGLLPGGRYATAEVALLPGDVGVLVTDGITEALDAGAVASALAALPAGADGPRSADRICERLMEIAARGRGPEGVDGWQDDRTVFVFAVVSDG